MIAAELVKQLREWNGYATFWQIKAACDQDPAVVDAIEAALALRWIIVGDLEPEDFDETAVIVTSRGLEENP